MIFNLYRRMIPFVALTAMLLCSAPAYAANDGEDQSATTDAPAAVAPAEPASNADKAKAGGKDTVAQTNPAQGEQAAAAKVTSKVEPAAAQAEAEYELPHQKWSFDGILGTYDRASLQRGFQVYKEVCSACHSMNRVSYRNLSDLGYSEAEIKAIAADVQIHDGPNDEGEMFDRPGKPSDHFKPPFANIQAAKAANGGAYPPDMSLLAKSREGGADYIYGILTGYEEPPAGKTMLPGQYWNKAMHGNIIAMPPPLTPDRVAYGDGSKQTVDQYARDVAHFLTWTSEPHMEERKRTGIKAFLFMLVFAGVMFCVKKKIWTRVH